ncbi:hypothetical protein CN585_08715 [Bacillus toyonensis]|uniref:Uncharacterized protein n=1 Tax=Bacillus toyonensis TaxID=155322 RepID=A0A2B6NT20_9BACI|nr:hypothetical protein BK702_03635 [Bacillus thuringiensis serovar cameroun]PEQ08590.1 hypothetical protein CN585_08715 [Bacillus toyonensis]PGC94884.1 hypothetical protein COM39_03730 [Bacillus toyonensis]
MHFFIGYYSPDVLGVAPNRHHLKKIEPPQNVKMSFLLQVSTKFRFWDTIKFLVDENTRLK